MVHAVGFRDGKAFYRDRFVRTDRFTAEQRAGRSLWAGIAEHPHSAVRAPGDTLPGWRTADHAPDAIGR